MNLKFSNYTLGLDMGVASLGWACVSTTGKQIDSGVRIFPAGLDNFNSSKEKHPNQDRRLARGMRRRIRRKAERKKLIQSFLLKLGWMPQNDEGLQKWHALDVYELRHRAIAEKIELSELGRIILHLNQRRGFLSLRKTEETEGDKETKGMLGEITALEEQIAKTESQTLGNYLYKLYQEKGNTEPLRKRHTNRKILHDEFSLIWETQAKHHSELTDLLRYGSTGKRTKPTKVVRPVKLEDNQSLLQQFGIENLTFFQRRVYWPAESIGRCELETDEQRAPIADRRFQEFRMLQEINNLIITDRSTPKTPTELKLSDPANNEIRQAAIHYLTGKDKPKLLALKKELCKKCPSLPSEPAQITFNLEAGGRTSISGTPTDAKLKGKNAYGSEWLKLTDGTRNAIINALTLPAATDEDIREALENIPDLPKEKIGTLLGISLPTSYGHISIKALEKLLPHLREGKLYMHKDPEKSALYAAGYQRRDELPHNQLQQLPLFRELVDPQSKHYDAHQTPINNPVVLRALTELRKVVNAIIRKHGKPTRIHLEMARELKMSPKQRSDHQKKTRGFEKEREEAAVILKDHGIIPTADALQLIRLWKEQTERCPYSGKTISLTQLLSGQGEIDIDHIYPYSRSADNSMNNKVVCLAHANRDKGNRTPYEWLADSEPERFEQVIQNTKSLPPFKAKRFYAKEIPEGFVNRDLNDTAWMSKAAHQYLARLMPKSHHVQGTKGTHTSILRNHWQLHSLLRNDGIDLKNRDDHRHHALDAILIALCDQTTIKKLLGKQNYRPQFTAAKQEGFKVYHLRHQGDKLSPPWPDFRNHVEQSLNSIWVSHRPKRKISGALHKETNYGKTHDGLLVVRKAVQSLSKKEIEGIRDPGIYKIIKQFITDHGGDTAALKTISKDEPLTMLSGTPIHKVRTAIPYAHLTLPPNGKRDFPLHVQSANTHHLAIFSLGDGKYHFEPVTLFEASRRLRSKEEVIQKTYPGIPPEAEFLFHLCSGDSMMATVDAADRLFIFNGVHAVDFTAKFISHLDATKNHKDPYIDKKKKIYAEELKRYESDEREIKPQKPVASLEFFCKPNTFEENFPNARKVELTPIGEIRCTN